MSESLLVFARRRPSEAVLLGLALFAALWLPELSWSSLTPPFDNLEQLAWSQSLQAGYYKHPPLPTWIMWLPAQLMGSSEWSSYLLGALCTLGALYLQWRLLSPVRGRRHAGIALLASLCITYYTGRLHYYNHDIVLMLFHSASALLCWKAMSSGDRRWWLALGVALGLGALTKYQVSVTAACVLVFWAWQGGWKQPRQREGLWLSALVGLALFTPHALWLHENDFEPIRYALSSSLGAHLPLPARAAQAVHWLVEQLLNRALPAWLLLGLAAWAARAPASPRESTGPAPLPREPDPQGGFRRLMLVWAGVPLAFMPLTSLFLGADLKMHWGLPFLLFGVPAAMELASGKVAWARARLGPVLRAFVWLQLLMLALNAAVSPKGPWIRDHRQERALDAAALARQIQAPARQALGGRICVVSGPHIPAAAIAHALDDAPKLLIEGRFDFSPWVDTGLVNRCGVLQVDVGSRLRPGWTPFGAPADGLQWRAIPPRPPDP